MALRDENNVRTGKVIVHDEIATVQRRGTPTGRTNLWLVTTRSAQGWVMPNPDYWRPVCR